MSKYSKKFHGDFAVQAFEATDGVPSSPPTLSTSSAPSSGRHRLERRGNSSSHTASGQSHAEIVGSSPAMDSDVSTGEGSFSTVTQQQQRRQQQEAKQMEASAAADEEADIDDAIHAESDDGATADPSSSGESAWHDHPPQQHQEQQQQRQHLYSCDLCPHLVFYSPDALQQHAVSQHRELCPDYVKLREVSAKLVPLWSQVKSRKAAVIRMWGKKIFHVARQRDAGPAKMAEAGRARQQLEHVVQRWHANARVFIFGSSVAFGVWDGISDIDFTVVDVAEMEAGTWPPQEKNAVRSITELLRRAGFSYVNLEPIPYARVPIIKHHASSPIRLASFRAVDRSAQTAGHEGLSETEREEASRWEAEDIVSRSVRYVLSGPASRTDRVVLEGSIRDAVGAEAVQQVWWNRTGEMMCITCDSTLSAIKAATCGLSFVTAGMRAKVQPLHDECRPELYNIDFDLSFRAFGIRNSELLNRYLTSHPCARPGAIVLKDWSKTSGVNNSVNGFLTSYAINIMWIYFLVQKGVIPYVDPIADVPASLVGKTNYGPTYSPMLPESLSEEELEALYDEAGGLLLDFFYFYGHEFDWNNHVVSLNRSGITTKRMLGWDQEDIAVPTASSHGMATSAGIPARKGVSVRYAFCIEDPYEENLNLGRHMGITKALRVQSELYRGLLSLLKDGEHHSCVFASTDRSEAATHTSHQRREEGGGADLSTTTSNAPDRLPLKVLYKLMGISIKEMARSKCEAIAQQQQQQQQRLSEQVEMNAPPPADVFTFAGLREEQLQTAFRQQAPLEYQLACKAWNWQQLVHRLGYKVHQGRIFARREVGVRRHQPPRGITLSSTASPSVAAAETAATTTTETTIMMTTATTEATTTATTATKMVGASATQRKKESTTLSERMAVALAEGFLRLTPEWVAWSKPWAALHLRGHTFFTSSSIDENNNNNNNNNNNKNDNNNNSGGEKPRVDGKIATVGGVFHPSPLQRMRWGGWSGAVATPTSPVDMSEPLRRNHCYSPSRVLKALLHK